MGTLSARRLAQKASQMARCTALYTTSRPVRATKAMGLQHSSGGSSHWDPAAIIMIQHTHLQRKNYRNSRFRQGKPYLIKLYVYIIKTQWQTSPKVLLENVLNIICTNKDTNKKKLSMTGTPADKTEPRHTETQKVFVHAASCLLTLFTWRSSPQAVAATGTSSGGIFHGRRGTLKWKTLNVNPGKSFFVCDNFLSWWL